MKRQPMSPSLKRAFALIGTTFLLLFIAIGFTLRAAFAHHEPMIDRAYFRKGVNYQARAQALTRARTEGWRLAGPLFTRPTVKSGVLRTNLILHVPPGKQVRSLELVARLERPATVKGSSSVTRSLKDARRIGSTLHIPVELRVGRAGYWEFIVEASVNTDRAVVRRSRFYAR